jgi:HEAT repeat protein
MFAKWLNISIGSNQYLRPRGVMGFFLVAAILLSNYSCRTENKESSMNMTQIKNRILAKDWEVIEDVKSVGPSATAILSQLATHEDRDVRVLSLVCLNETGSEEVSLIFANALKDKEMEVRNRAIAFLEKSYNPSVLPILIKELSSNKDEYIRSRIPLVMGSIGDRKVVPRLREELSRESEGELAENIHLALAKLGEEIEQKHILEGLDSSSDQIRFETLKKVEYIDDKRLVKRLSPLLNDRSEVFNISPGSPDLFMRICDFTVKVIGSLSDHPFSFPSDEIRIYKDEEITEVKRFVESLSN